MATSTAPPPAPAGPPPKKGKNKKGADPRDASEQIAAKIAQLEQDAAGEKDQDVEIEREVKKANRELSQLLSQFESPMKKVEEVRKRYSALFADMKRAEREHVKAKKRADQLQKEKDSGKTDLNKMTTLKERLEKMSRDLTKENKKLKVRFSANGLFQTRLQVLIVVCLLGGERTARSHRVPPPRRITPTPRTHDTRCRGCHQLQGESRTAAGGYRSG